MEKVFPRIGVAVFIIKRGKFIMGCRKNSHGADSWTVPGGHLEFGEKPEQTARREVWEETGLRIVNPKVVGITNDVFRKEGKHYITIWLISNWKSGREKIKEPDKFISQGWYGFSNLPKPLFLPWKQLLKSAFLNQIKQAVIRSNSL